MTLVRVSPSRSLSTWEPFWGTGLVEDLDRWVSDLWTTPTTSLKSDHIHPVINMFEDGNDLVIKAELPGISKDAIDISMSEGCLVIKAEKKMDETKGDRYLCERFYGQYFRSICLPFDVDSEKISATFENGLLEVRLPKTKVAEAKRIDIKVK